MKRTTPAFLLLCLLTWPRFAAGQTGSFAFSTIAGVAGIAGSADGTNDVARFDFPGGLTVDRFGALYVSDILNHTIRKLTPVGTNWVVTTLAGQAGVSGWADGTNTDAQFNRPNGIALDEAGNLFVADHYNHTIRKLTPAGTNWIVTTIAGLAGANGSVDGTNSLARFWSPTGVAVDKNDHVFVADTANFTVREVAPVGTNWVVTTIAGQTLNFGFTDGTNSYAQFDYPYGIAIDGAGHLFVTDWGNQAIRKIDPVGTDWIVTTIAGSSGMIGSDDGPGSFATFNFPNGICIDQAGNVDISDQSNDTIRKLTPSGNDWIVSTIAGQPLQIGTSDGLASDALFRHPWGIAVDRSGEFYVADYGNQTIRNGIFIPRLQIMRSLQRVILLWPASPSGYVLESSGSLDPTAPWSPLTNTPATNGPNLILTQQPGGVGAFYRLRKSPGYSPSRIR